MPQSGRGSQLSLLGGAPRGDVDGIIGSHLRPSLRSAPYKDTPFLATPSFAISSSLTYTFIKKKTPQQQQLCLENPSFSQVLLATSEAQPSKLSSHPAHLHPRSLFSSETQPRSIGSLLSRLLESTMSQLFLSLAHSKSMTSSEMPLPTTMSSSPVRTPTTLPV